MFRPRIGLLLVAVALTQIVAPGSAVAGKLPLTRETVKEAEDLVQTSLRLERDARERLYLGTAENDRAATENVDYGGRDVRTAAWIVEGSAFKGQEDAETTLDDVGSIDSEVNDVLGKAVYLGHGTVSKAESERLAGLLSEAIRKKKQGLSELNALYLRIAPSPESYFEVVPPPADGSLGVDVTTFSLPASVSGRRVDLEPQGPSPIAAAALVVPASFECGPGMCYVAVIDQMTEGHGYPVPAPLRLQVELDGKPATGVAVHQAQSFAVIPAKPGTTGSRVFADARRVLAADPATFAAGVSGWAPVRGGPAPAHDELERDFTEELAGTIADIERALEAQILREQRASGFGAPAGAKPQPPSATTPTTTTTAPSSGGAACTVSLTAGGTHTPTPSNNLDLTCTNAAYDTVVVTVSGHEPQGPEATSATGSTARCSVSGSMLRCVFKPGVPAADSWNPASVGWGYASGDSFSSPSHESACRASVDLVLESGGKQTYSRSGLMPAHCS